MVFTKQKLPTSKIYTQSVQFPLSFTSCASASKYSNYYRPGFKVKRVFSLNIRFINTGISMYLAILIFQ